MSFIKRLIDSMKNSISSLPSEIWTLNLGMTINVIAGSFLWPMNALFMKSELGKPSFVIGVVMFIYAGSTALGNWVGGALFDKFGGYRSTITGIVITLTALVGLNINHGWPCYPLFLMFIGLGQGIVFPSINAMVGTTWPEGGRKAYNAGYVLQNLGVAIGAYLGGMTAEYLSFDYSFRGFLGFYIIFLLIAIFKIRKIKPRINYSITKKEDAHLEKGDSKRIYALMMIGFAFLLCWVGYVQWQNTIPLHVRSMGMTMDQYANFWMLNGSFIVFMQPVLSRILRYFKLSNKKLIIIGLLIFMISHFITGNVQSYKGYLLSMCILTTAEMLIWPTVPTIANNLAPRGKSGMFQGISAMFATGGRAIGPLIGLTIADAFSIQVLFMGIIGLMAIAGVFVYFHDFWLNKNSERSVSL
ncbi:MAG: transporter [Bacillales bacterium]|nr:transporter [Bacillales bacterium]